MKDEKIKQIVVTLWNAALYSRKHIPDPRRTANETSLSHHQLFCLSALIDMHSATMSELAERLGVSNQQMTRIVNELETLGLVCRYMSETNRRRVYVKIGKQGEERVAEHTKAAIRYMAAKLETLTEDELDSFIFHMNELKKLFLKLQF